MGIPAHELLSASDHPLGFIRLSLRKMYSGQNAFLRVVSFVRKAVQIPLNGTGLFFRVDLKESVAGGWSVEDVVVLSLRLQLGRGGFCRLFGLALCLVQKDSQVSFIQNKKEVESLALQI